MNENLRVKKLLCFGRCLFFQGQRIYLFVICNKSISLIIMHIQALTQVCVKIIIINKYISAFLFYFNQWLKVKIKSSTIINLNNDLNRAKTGQIVFLILSFSILLVCMYVHLWVCYEVHNNEKLLDIKMKKIKTKFQHTRPCQHVKTLIVYFNSLLVEVTSST